MVFGFRDLGLRVKFMVGVYGLGLGFMVSGLHF